jgi:predicted regulator of Ras-like GTPase activity (Roadblock/LC7/MglB family)
MKQLKESQEPSAQVPRFRYWSTPPETVVIPVAAFESMIPAESRIEAFEAGQTVALPAAEIFVSNVPRIRLSRLAELLPRHIRPGDGKVLLPVPQLVPVYRLVEHREELPEEREPEQPGAVVDGGAVETSAEPFDLPVNEPLDVSESERIGAADPALDTFQTAGPEAHESEAAEVPPPPPVEVPTPKTLPRRPGILPILPMFRRRAPGVADAPPVVMIPKPVEPPPDLPPPPKPAARTTPILRLPEQPLPQVDLAPMAGGSFESVGEVPEASVDRVEVATDPIPEAVGEYVEAVETAESEGPVVRVLATEHFSAAVTASELHDEEAMQALFLTEEKLSVSRVIELCGGLPGINSCVLSHGTVVVAAHNAPENVDLVSLSAHAAEMLKAMRDSSARMGVGMVPAVTLHTEKGVISFFNREDLTMLVFHKDRGFVPGVREKMAAVLGELTKARIALPAGDERLEGGPSDPPRVDY